MADPHAADLVAAHVNTFIVPHRLSNMLEEPIFIIKLILKQSEPLQPILSRLEQRLFGVLDSSSHSLALLGQKEVDGEKEGEIMILKLDVPIKALGRVKWVRMG